MTYNYAKISFEAPDLFNVSFAESASAGTPSVALAVNGLR